MIKHVRFQPTFSLSLSVFFRLFLPWHGVHAYGFCGLFSFVLYYNGRNFSSKFPDKIDRWFSSCLLLSLAINGILADGFRCMLFTCKCGFPETMLLSMRQKKIELAFETVFYHNKHVKIPNSMDQQKCQTNKKILNRQNKMPESLDAHKQQLFL